MFLAVVNTEGQGVVTGARLIWPARISAVSRQLVGVDEVQRCGLVWRD